MKYRVGDKVASRKCGTCEAFVGVVTLAAISGKSEEYYHVIDDAGVEWHRSPEDLAHLYDNATPTQAAA